MALVPDADVSRGLGVYFRLDFNPNLSIHSVRDDYGPPSGGPWAQVVVTGCVPLLPKVKAPLSSTSYQMAVAYAAYPSFLY